MPKNTLHSNHTARLSYSTLHKTDRKKNITYNGHKQKITDEFIAFGGTSKASFQLKWLASTTIAGVTGILGILVAVYTSIDTSKNTSFIETLQSQSQKSFEIFRPTVLSENTASEKGDRIFSKGQSIAYTIHDAIVQERNGREFIATKPYIKVVGKLATYRINAKNEIPTFNPYQLYANPKPLNSDNNKDKIINSNITTKITNFSPRQQPNIYKVRQLNHDDVYKLTTLAGDTLLKAASFRPALITDNAAQSDDANTAENHQEKTLIKEPTLKDDKYLKNSTTIAKNSTPPDPMENVEERTVEVQSGETFSGILGRLGTTGKPRQNIIKAMADIYPAHKIRVGQKINFTLLPVERNSDKLEPVKVSLYNKSRTRHLITVSLDAKGNYIGSAKKVSSLFMRGRKVSRTRHATLYNSVYESALMLNLPKKDIIKLMRIHAFETDYKKRVQPNDNFQAFFAATKDNQLSKNVISDLLYTSISVGKETRSYYRFRLPDGTIDYYDKDGKSAQKFLMLKPVRTARLTSGFGYRFHPILKKKKLHQGIDWAGVPVGTPILAAGNGTVEVARPAGGYGNYVRIRHANGYKSAYAHMVRFAEGMKKGIKVRQGQVIGYLGNTGRSTGAHLHFEILVNNKRVNPMAINVPSGKNLSGKLAEAFQAERLRIEGLMQKPPVKTKIASAE